jgi:hypothetical protein
MRFTAATTSRKKNGTVGQLNQTGSTSAADI